MNVLTTTLLILGAFAAAEGPAAERARLLRLLEVGENVRQKYLGLTEQEVLDCKGPPTSKDGNTWTYCPLHPGFISRLHITTITFREGRVVQLRERWEPVGCMIVRPVREK
jgi:hypothetical protein